MTRWSRKRPFPARCRTAAHDGEAPAAAARRRHGVAFRGKTCSSLTRLLLHTTCRKMMQGKPKQLGRKATESKQAAKRPRSDPAAAAAATASAATAVAANLLRRDDSDLHGLAGDLEEQLPNDSDIEERFGPAARAQRAAAAATAMHKHHAGQQPVDAAGPKAVAGAGCFEAGDNKELPAQQQQRRRRPRQVPAPPQPQPPPPPAAQAGSSGSSQGATSAPPQPGPPAGPAIKQEPGLEPEDDPLLPLPEQQSQGQHGPMPAGQPAGDRQGRQAAPPAGAAAAAGLLQGLAGPAGGPAAAADAFNGPSPASPVYEPVARQPIQQPPPQWVHGNGGPPHGPPPAAPSSSQQRQLSGSSFSRPSGAPSGQGQQRQQGSQQQAGRLVRPEQPALYNEHNLREMVLTKEELLAAVPIELELQREPCWAGSAIVRPCCAE